MLGVVIQRMAPGDGKTFPKRGDKVEIHYVGTLSGSGKVFDSSRDREEPLVVPIGVGNVIQGWDDAIPQLSLGEKAVLLIEPQAAYGARGYGSLIPPNSHLKFEVELLSINK